MCEAMCVCLCLCLCRGLSVLLLLQKMFSYSRMCSLTTGYVLDRSLGVLLFYYRMCSLTQECVLLLQAMCSIAVFVSFSSECPMLEKLAEKVKTVAKTVVKTVGLGVLLFRVPHA